MQLAYLCLSGQAKRLSIWTPCLDLTLLAPVPHREVMLTILKRFCACCLSRRQLLGEIARVAARTVTAAIRTLTGERKRVVDHVGWPAKETPRLSKAFRSAVFRRFMRLHWTNAGNARAVRAGIIRGTSAVSD